MSFVALTNGLQRSKSNSFIFFAAVHIMVPFYLSNWHYFSNLVQRPRRLRRTYSVIAYNTHMNIVLSYVLIGPCLVSNCVIDIIVLTPHLVSLITLC